MARTSRDTPLSPKILMGFCSDGPFECTGQIRSPYSITRSWYNSDWCLGWGCESNLGEEEAVVGRGWYRSKERLWVPIGSPIVTFPLFLRVSEILPLLCCSTPLFPTPSLVSCKFPHVPLGLGGWPLSYEERRCWANCPSWSTNVTDRQTDLHCRQTDDMQSQDALCTIVHRAFKQFGSQSCEGFWI